jgi:hypothetical protein
LKREIYLFSREQWLSAFIQTSGRTVGIMKAKTFKGISGVTLLILCFLGGYASFSQADLACNIEWWGDLEGIASTDETSRTEQATQEAFEAIYSGSPMGCEFLVDFSAYCCYACSAGLTCSDFRIQFG